jgi:translation elongation factor EF-G
MVRFAPQVCGLMSQGRASYTMQFLAYEPAEETLAEEYHRQERAGTTQRVLI